MTQPLFGLPTTRQPEAPRPAPPAGRTPLTEATKAILAAAGAMDAATGAFRSAARTRCPICARQVWRGLDSDRGARSQDADPYPLTALGEAMARLGGWRTITLRQAGNRYNLDLRDGSIILAEPAGSIKGCDVLLIHDCHGDITKLQFAPSQITPVASPAARAAAMPIEPPF